MRRVLLVLGAALVALFILSGCGPEQEGSDKSVPTPTPTVTSVAVVCPGSWAVVVNDRGDKNRWVAAGVPAIAKAKTAKQAEKALDKWLVIVREDNVLLAGAVNEFFGEDFKPEDFVDGKCINEQGSQWALKLEGALATAVVKPATAPATGANNTGVEGEKVVSSDTAVITGDRAAVKVTLAGGKGETVWVMARCGNLVVKKPVSPKGKTDNPTPPKPKPTHKPKPKPKPKCPDGTPIPPNGLCPKDPKKDVLVNPSVPAQVKGPGKTPVGSSPGPATKPVDDNNGGAPAPSKSPSPTSAPPPPSGGGTDPGVIPEPTVSSAPQPEISTDPPAEESIAPPPPPPA